MTNRIHRQRLAAAAIISFVVLLGVGILIIRQRAREQFAGPDQQKTIATQDKAATPSGRPAATARPPQAKTYEDDVELPYPKDTEAVARFYGEPGGKRLSDAQVVWQKRAEAYIKFLKKESFEQGTYLTYMTCELVQVHSLGGGPFAWCPYDAVTVRMLCRTRRFSKLISHVEHARNLGKLDDTIKVLAANVERFITEARDVEDQLKELAEREPEIFPNDAPEQQRRRFIRLYRGYALSGLEIPEGAIPMSMDGASLGLAANSFLLGLTGDPRGVAPLLKVAEYENTEFQKKLSSVLTDPLVIVKPNCLANFVVIADALDRILVNCAAADRDDVTAAARAVAQQYVEFCTKQDWTAREAVQLWPYDAPQTPWNLPGALTGVTEEAELMQVSLPLPLAERIPNTSYYERGITDRMAPIFEYAHRFQQALDSDKT